MWRVCLLVFLVACGGGDPPLNPPLDANRHDAHVDLPDAPSPPPDAPTIRGTVCLLVNLRDPQCNPDGTGVLAVTLESAAGVELAAKPTNVMGAFSLVTEVPSGAVWHVRASNGLRSTRMSVVFDEDGNLVTPISIPVMAEIAYVALFGQNGGVEAPNQGALVVHVTRSNNGLANATVTTANSLAVRYDGDTVTAWDTDRTGPKGVAWVLMAPAGPLTFTTTPPVGAELELTETIEDDTITFRSVDR